MKRTAWFFLCLFFFSLLLSGCGTENDITNPEMIEEIIADTINSTHEAISQKDIELARELWGQISEYGMKAGEMEEKELAEGLGKLAATYSYLIDYLQTGDEEYLEMFNSGFEKAVAEIENYTE